jgi:hypothetical protein
VSAQTFEWSGDFGDEPKVAPFLRQVDGPYEPPVCWWLEPDLSGRCDLLITRQLSKEQPLRVRPGQSVVLEGRAFRAAGVPR